ncbi:MAG: hypothetical protein K6E53_12120 [Lachnospiraceae bacterium]|nr:hypothetical protein [Lachnospiraceae bacterium]
MLRFIKKVIQFVILFAVSGICIAVFDYFVLGNQHLGNYQASILDKTTRFNSIESPKIVLIGNSNLAFGIDSEKIEDETGMPVVNMGLHGGLGSPFNENMVRLGKIGEGDIVILSHHTYDDADDIEDPSLALITIEKHRDLWKLIRGKDLYGIAKAYPDYVKDCIIYKYTNEDDNTPEETTSYSRSAFNKYGDIDRRFEEDDNFTFYPGTVTVPGINDICAGRINELNRYIKDKGATLLIAGYPIGSGEYTPSSDEYDDFEQRLRDSVDCEVISHFTDYFIPYEYFYDTKYHLDDTGVEIRTEQLIRDIEAWKQIQ